MTIINNKVKVRQKTKLLILRKTKVISYKDFKKARVKRAEKDVIKEVKDKGKRSYKYRSATLKINKASLVKAKRGRKYKSALLKVDAPEPNIKVARISKALLTEIATVSVV